MCKRIETINRCYNALEYEVNKQDALKKISTLHCELKFKDPNNFSDRFLQTTSVIEENLSVFNSACDHVDIVTTILEFLNTIGVELMFNNKTCNEDNLNIIYMMFIIFEEHEILSFFKAALIDNSRLAHINEIYEPLTSNYVFEMIVFEDADLYAIISYLKITPAFISNIKKIFVQESIKQKFLWLIEKYFKHVHTCSDLPISTFHSKKELLMSPYNDANLFMASIWSEDIVAAKILAMTLRRDVTYINAHLEFCCNITFFSKWSTSQYNLLNRPGFIEYKYTDEHKIEPREYVGLLHNLFYNGTWQKPVEDTYWLHEGNTYAQATEEDRWGCIKSAEEAFKSWSILPVDSKKKILKDLASTLECNGKIMLAKIVLEWLKYATITDKLICEDERLEITSFRGPKGVVSIFHENEVTLFSYLVFSLIIGNCVIVLCNKNTCIAAPYFDMFSTAEIPPGVINLLSNNDVCAHLPSLTYHDLNDIYNCCSSTNHIILPLK